MEIVELRPRVGQIYQERYLISAELGSGGMGSVFRATQTDADREVALKILHSDRINDSENVARFYREFKILSTLSHPGIMTLYGLALDDDSVPYAICEFIDGVSLRKPLLEGPFPWQRAIKIAMQICQSMQYAHDQGILHRDLKPDNILLMQNPEPDSVKLIDFGLSRAVEALHGAQKLTTTGFLVGSPQYMSPEQITGKATVQSDIYALGCILFELLSGEILVDADSSTAVIYKHLNEDMSVRLRTLTKVPNALLAAMDKMLKKSPEQRFQSMSEVHQELEKILEDPNRKSPYAAPVKIPIKLFALVLAPVALIAVLAFHMSQTHTSPAEIMKKKPSSIAAKPAAHSLREDSMLLRAHKKNSEAMEILTRALNSPAAKNDPTLLYDIHSELAYCHENKNELAEAAKEWELAIEEFDYPAAPKRLDARTELARIETRRGFLEKAEALYKKNIADCESSTNVSRSAIVRCYCKYGIYLIQRKNLNKAYTMTKKALIYSNKSSHGSSGVVAEDRATIDGVACTWQFYDICHALGKNAEGLREVVETEKQLRTSIVQDNYTVFAMLCFADMALARSYFRLAKTEYEMVLEKAKRLSVEDATSVLGRSSKGLAYINAQEGVEKKSEIQN